MNAEKECIIIDISIYSALRSQGFLQEKDQSHGRERLQQKDRYRHESQ